MAGVVMVQLRLSVVVVLVALVFSLASVSADYQEEAQKEYLAWMDRRVQEYEATSKTVVKVDGSVDAPEVHSFATTQTVTITVNPKKGKADFQKLQKAIDSIPDKSSTRYLILVAAGRYKEKVVISSKKGPITIQGAGMISTVVTYDLTNEEAGGTMASSSVSVSSDDFIAKDISFENTSPSPPPGAVGKQAVAFMINGDKGAFWRVAFLGYQDTLYDKLGRHYFKDCYVRGTIDFVFGDGKSYYDSCYLDSVATTSGSFTAQKRESTRDSSGFSFVNCVLNGTGYSYLGRAWGASSRVVFIRSYMTAAIRPEGWYNWGVPGRENTVFYGEYQCYGPGSNRDGREPWSLELSDSQVKPFLTTDWIQGSKWLPTGPQ